MNPASPDSAPSSPKVGLRADLELSWQRHQDSAVLVVKDPVTRRYFRFTETQAAIVELMMPPAAPIDAEMLSEAASQKLGRAVRPAALTAFFNSLEQKYLVDTPRVREALAALDGHKLKEQRNLLYWKLGAIDPERIFNWLLPRTRWMFQPAFHALAAFVILCGFYIFFANLREIAASSPRLFSVYGLALVIPMVFGVVTIHEFAHGLVCRHYGGKVHEVGFMLIYFQPAFYCDVSDSWLFSSKRHRMWVTFAGGYSQFIVWGLCAIVWRITDADAFVNQAALAVLLYSGVQSLINFNPLIKLDGYYMLSDYLEIPNLRARATEAVWARISGKTAKREGDNPRSLRAQLVYGGTALVFSTALLLYVYASLYTWTTSRYGFAGLVGFAMFSTYTLRKTAAESITGLRAMAGQKSAKRLRNLVILGVLALVAWFGRWELKIPAEFTVIAGDDQTVRAVKEGLIVKILVQEGSEVKQGEVLAQQLDVDVDRQQSFREIVGLLREKRSLLQQLRNGATPEEFDRKNKLIARRQVEMEIPHRNQEEHKRLEQTLTGRTSALALAEQNRDRLRLGMVDGLDKLFPQQQMDQAESEADIRRSEVAETEAAIRALTETADRESDLNAMLLAEAQSDLRLLQAGNRPEVIQQQEAQIAKLEAQWALLDRVLAKTDIRAPIDGVVATPLIQRKFNTLLKAGDEFCRIVDLRRVTVEMKVPEKEMEDVVTGKIVWMTLRSFPNEAISGHVDFIPPLAQITADGQHIMAVRSDLENRKRNGVYLLKPELTGTAQIYCGDRSILDLLTRRLRRWINTEFWPLIP